MDALLHTTFDKITFGTQMLKRDLCLLELQPMAPERISPKNVIEESVRGVMQLQFHVASLMARYLYAGFCQPVGPVSQILDGLWGVFVSLDEMYSALTAPDRQADADGLHPAELKQLQILWIRLNRLTKQAREHLENGQLLTAGERCEAIH